MQDTPADNLSDSQAMRWVSFAELADARGISKASATRLVRRRGWRRQRDNQGHVRALVPETWLNGQEDRPPDNPGDNLPDAAFHVKALSVLEETLTTLHGELVTVRDERDRARADARSAQERADGAARELAAAQHDAQTALQAVAKAEARTTRAEQGEEVERARADTISALLEATQEELAGQRALTDHARTQAQEAQDAAEALRRAEAERKARGLVARLRAAWRGP